VVVAELNAREKALEQREIGLEVTPQNLSQKNQNLSLVSM
jgi:hypothetical protein